MANTATLYDLTTKEYLHLGKVGDNFFTEVLDKEIVSFLTRVKQGHMIEIYYDSKGEPENFYTKKEFEQWKEVRPIAQQREN